MKQTVRRCRWALVGLLAGLAIVPGITGETQAIKPPVPGAAATARISAQSGPYTIEWNGSSGTFTRRTLTGEVEEKMPLVYLQTDPGPNGYAKHLAWFLARDNDHFALLWCYLDDKGHNFWCWLYRYPANQLTTISFVGDYEYGPMPATDRPVMPAGFLSGPPPVYTGTDFAYRDWTRKGGKLDKLTLATGLANGQALTVQPGKGLRPLTDLRVVPLHEIQVSQGNGWRPGGWRELHALAYDALNDPYYLILYSNTPIGYAVDLKRAQPYVADFGARVRFGSETVAFGPNGRPVDDTDTPRILRNSRYEIVLRTAAKSEHPYTEINVDAELKTPDGKVERVPGYWDGDNVFRARVLPLRLGTWRWRILSNNSELNGKTGKFECVAASGGEPGFLHISSNRANQRYYVRDASTPYYPVYISGSLSQDWSARTADGGAQLRAVALGGAREGDGFEAYQKRVDALAAVGFNRVYGDFLLGDVSQPGSLGRNEGGTAFVGGDIDQLNPAFFQAMDRRIAYANLKGITPDLGVSVSAESLYAKYTDIQVRRLWRYIVGRYASYDVFWNLFGNNWAGGNIPAPRLEPHVEGLASLTRMYDPYAHPLSTLTRFVQSPTGSSTAAWDDVLTVPLSDTPAVDYLYTFNKPILVVDAPSMYAADSKAKEVPAPSIPPDSFRRRMWETRMRGGYWVSPLPLDGIQQQWVLNAARFFKTTRYWRLEPHQEMLGGPSETPAAQRRRKMAEAEARKKNPEAPIPGDAAHPAPPAGPIYVLADPSHEYVIYFETGGSVTLDLLEATGRNKVQWFNPRTGETRDVGDIFGGAYQTFIAPTPEDWILYIARH